MPAAYLEASGRTRTANIAKKSTFRATKKKQFRLRKRRTIDMHKGPIMLDSSAKKFEQKKFKPVFCKKIVHIMLAAK